MNALKDETTKTSFKLTLNNRFQILQEMLTGEDMDVHTLWEQTKEAVQTTCRKELGPLKKHQKEWIKEETLRKIEIRKLQDKGEESKSTGRLYPSTQDSPIHDQERQRRLL